MKSTDIGYINKNNQEVIRRTDIQGTDYQQRVYVVRCNKPNCGYEYGANGTDLFERMCPKCQNGAPGLSY